MADAKLDPQSNLLPAEDESSRSPDDDPAHRSPSPSVESGDAASADNNEATTIDDEAATIFAPAVKNFQRRMEDFNCGHCGHLEEGDGYTNHCSQCLYSKHVDINPGDRLAECCGLMPPIAGDTKKGNYRIFQRCEGCGHERWNKAQERDDFDMVLKVSGN
jgi:hypothetical protein